MGGAQPHRELLANWGNYAMVVGPILGLVVLAIWVRERARARRNQENRDLAVAVRLDQIGRAAFLLRDGAKANVGVLLRDAAGADRRDMAEVLVAGGADVNAADRRGMTPLHAAAQRGHVKTAQLLIEKGADVNAVTPDLDAPLDLAARAGHEEVAALLRAHGGRPGMEVAPPGRAG